MRKLNDFLVSHRFVQVVITLTLVIFFSFIYLRMITRNAELEDYWLAISCPSVNNCREKQEAKILESYGMTVYVKGFATKHGGLPSSRNTHYGVLLFTPLGDREIEIKANSPSNGTPFDIPNVRIPTGKDSLFVSENLSVDQAVYIEVWKDKITVLYLDKYFDTPDRILQPTPNPTVKPAFIDNPSPKTYEIALPTTVHPILLQAEAERDFLGTILICTLILITIYMNDLNNFGRLFSRLAKTQ